MQTQKWGGRLEENNVNNNSNVKVKVFSLSGHLQKKVGETTKKYWCVLDQNSLHYYDSKEDYEKKSNPSETLLISSISGIFAKDLAFVISKNDKEEYHICETNEEKRYWVTGISNILSSKDKVDNEGSNFSTGVTSIRDADNIFPEIKTINIVEIKRVNPVKIVPQVVTSTSTSTPAPNNNNNNNNNNMNPPSGNNRANSPNRMRPPNTNPNNNPNNNNMRPNPNQNSNQPNRPNPNLHHPNNNTNNSNNQMMKRNPNNNVTRNTNMPTPNLVNGIQPPRRPPPTNQINNNNNNNNNNHINQRVTNTPVGPKLTLQSTPIEDIAPIPRPSNNPPVRNTQNPQNNYTNNTQNFNQSTNPNQTPSNINNNNSSNNSNNNNNMTNMNNNNNNISNNQNSTVKIIPNSELSIINELEDLSQSLQTTFGSPPKSPPVLSPRSPPVLSPRSPTLISPRSERADTDDQFDNDLDEFESNSGRGNEKKYPLPRYVSVSFQKDIEKIEIRYLDGENIHWQRDMVDFLIDQKVVEGVIIITNYRVIFIPRERDSALPYAVNYELGIGAPIDYAHRDLRSFDRSEYVEIPIMSIMKMGKSSRKATGYKLKLVVISTFDCRKMTFSFRSCSKERIHFFNEVKRISPKVYNDIFGITIGNIIVSTRRVDRLSTYDNYSVFMKMIQNTTHEKNWRITQANETFELCASYPVHLLVPNSITDYELFACAKFRIKGRFPVVSWVNPKNNASIIRSSLPTLDRCIEDEKLLAAYGNLNTTSNLLYIIDTRAKSKLVSDVTKGAGTESTSFYKNIKMVYLECPTSSKTKESWLKLVELIQENKSSDNWFSLLENTKWLHYIHRLLSSAAKIANIIDQRGNSVMIHCKYGWHTSPQLSSLVQVMLCDEFRTIRGFQHLIEREWIAYGYPFSTECCQYQSQNSMPSGSSITDDDREFSKIDNRLSFTFIQFLNCVWQLTVFYPSYFDFNDRFLITIADAAYNGLYGTFLCNVEKDRYLFSSYSRTLSLWTDIMSDLKKYQNPYYIRRGKSIIPTVHLRNLSLWNSYFDRYSEPLIESTEEKYFSLLQENYELRKNLASFKRSK